MADNIFYVQDVNKTTFVAAKFLQYNGQYILDQNANSLPVELQMLQDQGADAIRIRKDSNGSGNWRCIPITQPREGAVMSWTLGTGTHHNIGRQADMPHPALVGNDGVKLLHLGLDRSDHTEVFDYQDRLIKEFSLIATRYANFHGRVLANDGQLLTDTWTVNFADFMIVPRPDVVLSTEVLEQIKRNIEDALLSHPLWPTSYGRSDLPAKSVNFIFAE